MRYLFCVLLAGGCTLAAEVVDPPVAQLARWRTADPATIAAEPVACSPGHPACGRLHAMRAEACLGRALAARAPGAACPGPGQVAALDCAGASYAAAVAVQASPPLQAGLAQALLCRAEFDAPKAAAGRAAQAAVAARLAPNAAFYGAWAALIAARPGAGTNTERCVAARRAATLGHAAGPPARDRLLADAAAQLGTIPGCEAPR